jgi:hypothetical protein
VTQREHPLKERDQDPAFPATSHSVFSDPKLEKLSGRNDAVLRLGEGPNRRCGISIPHPTPLQLRTASNFLPASPEI